MILKCILDRGPLPCGILEGLYMALLICVILITGGEFPFRVGAGKSFIPLLLHNGVSQPQLWLRFGPGGGAVLCTI